MKFPVKVSCAAPYIMYGNDRGFSIKKLGILVKCQELWLGGLSVWHLVKLEISGANGLLSID